MLCNPTPPVLHPVAARILFPESSGCNLTAELIALPLKICYNFNGLIWVFAYLNYTRKRGLSGSLFSFWHRKIGILSDADNGLILLQPPFAISSEHVCHVHVAAVAVNAIRESEHFVKAFG